MRKGDILSDKRRILIFSVGGTKEPIEFAINQYDPDYVYFIHSENSKKDFKNIVKDTNNTYYYEFVEDEKRISNFNSTIKLDFSYEGNIEINQRYIEYEYSNYLLEDHEDIDKDFNLSKDVLNDVKNFISKSEDNFEVIVDITGGTKAMSSGLALAAVAGDYKDFKINYVGGEDRTKSGVGIVKENTEINKLIANPASTNAIFEMNRGKNFFNKYNFDAAFENFAQVVELEDNKLASLYLDLVKFYDRWDKFEITMEDNGEDLYSYLSNIIEKINCDDDFSKFRETQFFNQMENNLDFLSYKIRGLLPAQPKSLAYKKFIDKIEYYIPDLLKNAERRIDEGKYDDAVARLYRLNELISQKELISYVDKNELNEKHKFLFNVEKMKNKIRKNRIRGEGATSVLKLKGNEGKNNKYNKFKGVANKYNFLYDMGIIKNKSYKNIISKLDDRNDSILAHGLNPINNDANILYWETNKFTKSFVDILEYYMNLAEFPKFE